MGRLEYRFFSPVLEHHTSMEVMVPDGHTERPEGGYPVLYMLHGLTENSSSWGRNSVLERLSGERGLLVVLPEVSRSWYCDEKFGLPYWRHLTEEVVALARRLFGASSERRHNHVAGLSMGGYGAMKWCLQRPSMFATAASLSGALLRAQWKPPKDDPAHPRIEIENMRIWGGSDPVGSDDDVLQLLGKADPTALPELYASCGKQDFLLGHTQTFVARAQERGINVTTRFAEGEHTWSYWDSDVPAYLEWLDGVLAKAD